MKRRIIDIFAHYENQEEKHFLLTEEEERQLTQEIDLDRVKKNVMKQVNGEESNMNKNKGTKKYRAGIVAAALVLTFSTTALASQYFDGFKQFFGGSASVSDKERSSIQKSITKSGVKMTLEESVVVGNTGYLVVTFIKEDGTAFPADAKVQNWDFKIGVEGPNTSLLGQKLVDNNEKLILMFEQTYLSNSEMLKTTTFTADKITNADYIPLFDEEWSIEFVMTPGQQKQQDINLAIDKKNEKLILTKVSVSSIGVAIEGTLADGKNEDLPKYSPEVEVIADNGETIALRLGGTDATYNGSGATYDGFQWLYNMDIERNYTFLGDIDIKSVIIDGTKFDLK